MLSEGVLRYQVSPKKEYKKLVLVLAISTPVTRTGEKEVEITEIARTVKTARIGKNGKKSKDSKYLGNLV